MGEGRSGRVDAWCSLSMHLRPQMEAALAAQLLLEPRGWELSVRGEGGVQAVMKGASTGLRVGSMHDRRAALLRARAEALLRLPRTRKLAAEVARLNAESEASLAARAAGESQWGSELPPPVLQQVLELLQWEPAVCGVMRLVCSTWGSILDAHLPRLRARHSMAVMEGKLGWYESVTDVDLTGCEEEDVSGVLAELGRMPSLRSLKLPGLCAERAVDAEAVRGLTTLTTLSFSRSTRKFAEATGELVLDLSRLTTLTSLDLAFCAAVACKEVLALCHLSGLTALNLGYCPNVTSEGLRAVRNLTALTTLDLWGCGGVTDEVLRTMSSLSSLTDLNIGDAINVTAEGLRAVSSLTALTSLHLCGSDGATNEGLRAVSSLTALTTLELCWSNVAAEGLLSLRSLTGLTTLNLAGCSNVSSEGLCAVRSLTALSNLNISCCSRVTSEVLRAVSSLTALTTLNLFNCRNVSSEGLRAVSSLTALTSLDLNSCPNVTAEVLRAVSSLTALTCLNLIKCSNLTNEGLHTLSSLIGLRTLDLRYCDNVTAAGKQALRTAIPHLTIEDWC
jgi:hypothetical protein